MQTIITKRARSHDVSQHSLLQRRDRLQLHLGPRGTNGSPLGNGTYKLHAIAADPTGLSTDLGTTIITANNAASVHPFGTIDTPAQGQTISGTDYVNFGWVVTPQPNIVPIDGSTIMCPPRASSAVRAGARGYLLKDSIDSDLVNAVRSVAKGDGYLSPAVSDAVLSYYRRHVTDPLDLLTSREVASALNLSVYTIDAHRGKIMEKLNLHSTGELVRFAVRNGLID
jgi:Bacterial regulatory proteins, luxR family